MVNRFNISYLLVIAAVLTGVNARSQNYHAIHGSSYAGSLGAGNNPASIVNTPYPWDVTVFAAQIKYTTNAATVYKYSLLSSARKSQYGFDNGNYSRYGDFNYNANILNARIALSRKHSIAFGMNVRGYGELQTSPYNYIDTIRKLNHLLKLNTDATKYETDLLHSSWIELFATYGRTIRDEETDRLNVGITVKAMRGISAAHASVKDVRLEKQAAANVPVYKLVSGSVVLGYSSNYDGWNENKATSDNLMNFLTHSEGGFSIDLGAEYLVKSQAVTSFHDDENYYDYEWKIGVSFLDLGQNNYKYGNNSRSFSSVSVNLSDSSLNQKFKTVKSIKALNDSLASLVNTVTELHGIFNVINPARLVLNLDRHLSNAFFINAEFSLNLSSLAGSKKKYLKELNLLTITPRWETSRWGGYLPVTYNTHGKLWIGGALKAGPLLFGIHNWGNVFSSKKMANGGGYVALIVRSQHLTGNEQDKRYDCPPVF
jgi:hypothetical protein